MCEVKGGEAQYINTSKSVPLFHPKNAHFQTVPVKEVTLSEAMAQSGEVKANRFHTQNETNIERMLEEIKVNNSILTKDQRDRLRNIHVKHAAVFNEDLRGGFEDKDNPYYATLSFRQDNKAPHTKSGLHNTIKSV